MVHARSICEFPARHQRRLRVDEATPGFRVVAWLAEADEDRVFISVVTLAELRHGIERLPVGARQINPWSDG
jgi:predicted nucleic acid-binding protein